MSNQPEALRLADELRYAQEITFEGCGYKLVSPEDADDLAAELRRLHGVNQELYEALKNAMQFIDMSVNLEQPSFDSPPEPASQWDYDAYCLVGELHIALAKARGEG